MLLFPAFALLALIVVYPVGRLIYTSFFSLNLTSGMPAQFTGVDNFVSIVQDPVFWQSLENTVILTLVTVPGALVAGMILALIANLPFRYKWPVRLALLVPWALPLAFTGLIFAWFFNSDYGMVDDLLRRAGLPQPIWFNSALLSMAAICITLIWKTSSFVGLVLLAGLQTIPRELYEAADVDGAGRIRQYFSVTLPLLRPAIAVAMIFRMITALQTFDIPFTMTRGGPGDSTLTLAMYIYQNTVDFLDLGYGSALAVVMFLISMAVTCVLSAPDQEYGMTRVAPLRWIAAFVVVVNGLFPAMWIFLTSLKGEAELSRTPITYLPAQPTFVNYVHAFHDQPLLRYLANSLIVATASTGCTLIVSVMAAYALARLEIRFSDLALGAIIAISTFPLVTLLVPLFQTMRALGLLNTYGALVLPYTVLSLPVCTLVLVSFFQTIPADLENAAMVDGCTRVGALVRILVPIAAPGVALPASLPSSIRGMSFCSRCPLTPIPRIARCRWGSRCTRASSPFPGRRFPPRSWWGSYR